MLNWTKAGKGFEARAGKHGVFVVAPVAGGWKVVWRHAGRRKGLGTCGSLEAAQAHAALYN